MPSGIPRLASIDSTAVLLAEGYPYVARRCRRRGVDAVRTRILGEPVVCMTGADAARVFYGSGRFTRRRAIPRPTLTLLQDFGSVAVLDGEAHRHRKRLFMALMTPGRVAALVEEATTQWRAALPRWVAAGEVRLDDANREILCRAVCAWTGVPLSDAEAPHRAADLGAMFDGAGALGPRQVRGQRARRRGEAWIAGIVRAVRDGRIAAGADTPLHAIAFHRALDGQLLTTETAAVEMLNLLRPTVAVSRYITFAALALRQHPECRAAVQASADDTHRFVQEVRRTAPFFPLITGRVLSPFEWHGHGFEPGALVLLDIYGTNRDPRSWQDPDAFRPERFADWKGSPYTLIPQGAGEYLEDHRCAGEWVTIALMEGALRFLTRDISYGTPQQDLSVRLSRMPAIPRSRFTITDVRATG